MGTIIFLVLGILLPADPAPDPTPDPPSTLLADSTTAPAPSYAVYLPPGYTPDRKWPTLLCFDPAKRPMIPIELFQGAAEKLGFIIASSGSYDSADSVGRSIDVMASFWNDVISRYPVDFDRVYATGFSGGGRICWILDQLAKDVDIAGIIEVGAGLPRRDFLEGWQPRLAYYGLVGQTDFNYYEMRWLDGELDRRKVPHRLVTFDGGHEWPPAGACAEALGWMQIAAMRFHTIGADSALIEEIYARETSRITEAEQAGRLIEAHERASAAAAMFEGLRDITAAAEARDRLARSKAFATLRREREGLDRSASDRLAEVLETLELVPRARTFFERPSYAQLVNQIGLPALRLMRKSEDPEERLAGIRILDAIYARAGSAMPRELMRRGDYEGAAVLLRTAADIKPERPTVWYDLGCAYARTDRPRDAVLALERAVESGFDDAKGMETDPDLASVRQDTLFVRLLHRIEEN
jgi:predicted esterase